MLALYLFLLVVGGGIAVLSLMGDIFGGAELDIDMDVNMDMDMDMDAAGGPEMDGSSIWKAFSLMGAIYGLLGVGATGTALTLLWQGEQATLTAILAVGAGVASGGIATLILNYLKRSGSGAVESEASFEGRPAVVTLPVRAEIPGRIRVRRGSREHSLRALPYGTPDADEDPPESWTDVVVVEVRAGVAYVTPAGPELDRLGP